MAEEQFPDPEIQIRLATFDQYRSLLFSVAYRMLGSVADAEDMLQETFIRWQQAHDEEIRSPRAFLITIISRLCINHLQSARAQREEYVGQWLPEPIVTGPGSDPLEIVRIDESLSMAFLVMLERLTPVERAVFLLREVFAYEYAEIAAILSQSEANCRQILSRAKQHVGTMRPRFKTSQRKKRELLERFFKATSSGDMEGLVALLASDVVLHSDGGGKAAAAPNLIPRLRQGRSCRIGLLPKTDSKESGYPADADQRRSRHRQLSRWQAVLGSHIRRKRRPHPRCLCCLQPGKARPRAPAPGQFRIARMSQTSSLRCLLFRYVTGRSRCNITPAALRRKTSMPRANEPIRDTNPGVENIPAQNSQGPFLPPIEKPGGLMIKLVYYFTRRKFGKVPSPLAIHAARMPPAFGMFYGKVSQLDKKLRIPQETIFLIREQVARLNICLFCMDIGRVFAMNHR